MVHHGPEVVVDRFDAFEEGSSEPLPVLREIPLGDQGADHGPLRGDDEGGVEVEGQEQEEGAVVGVVGDYGLSDVVFIEIG